jgi:hypothetical protein
VGSLAGQGHAVRCARREVPLIEVVSETPYRFVIRRRFIRLPGDAAPPRGFAENPPEACKEVDQVIDASHTPKLSVPRSPVSAGARDVGNHCPGPKPLLTRVGLG